MASKREDTQQNPAQRKFQYIAAISASLATISTGTVLGWTSQISDDLLNGYLPFNITEDGLGWISSSPSLGAAFLSLLIGPICDQFGRKLTMLIMIILMEIGWILIIFSKSLWMLVAGRFLTGMVAGAYCVTVSLYINEISQKEIRGKLGCLTQLMIAIGIFLANSIGIFLNIKQFCIVCAIAPIIFGLIFVWMPETPTFLLLKLKPQEAGKSLMKLRGPEYDVSKEIENIQQNLSYKNRESILNCLSKMSTKKACFIAGGIVIFRVLCGIDSVTSYLSYILQNTKTDITPKIETIIFSGVQVISVIGQAFIIDKCDRRILLIISELIMSICLFTIGGTFLLPTNNFLQYIPFISVSLYAVAFSLGLGPIGWIICAEIFPTEIKAYAMSCCTFLIWLLTFSSVKTFITISTYCGLYLGFFIYSILSIIGTVFILLFVPETKNKSYDEIEAKLSGK